MEDVDVSKQINLELDDNEVQEPFYSHHQEPKIRKLLEMHGGKRAFDDNKGSTSTQTSMVSKIKSRKYSQKYLSFGLTTTEVNDEEKGFSTLCVKTYTSEEQHVKVVFKT
ncbi:hypothetical protein TNCV_3046361 [Trichonephila clavipes]|uniref:Uncharacterized protein n=1 Tax=Trichonephila clavipes TaxID=2585209 RepID=A0A8X6RM58_TRICX|nr:hypothetical protein TNCV_3046361 [Trichonephila clavipes]